MICSAMLAPNQTKETTNEAWDIKYYIQADSKILGI